jgi:hypothetical protein
LKLTFAPFTAMRVMIIPSVSSDGTHGAARGTLNRKWFMSSRIPICRRVSGLSFLITTVSVPVRRCVDGSSFTLIV